MVKNKGVGGQERFIQCGTLGREPKRVNDAPLPPGLSSGSWCEMQAHMKDKSTAKLSIPGPGAVLSVPDSLESQLYFPSGGLEVASLFPEEKCPF